MRSQKQIIIEIRSLLDELDGSLGLEKINLSSTKKIIKENIKLAPPKGALGAVNMLIDEKFLDTPKEISTILQKLKEVGHYHKSTAIAMNLLNLTKRRILNRFQNKETKNWEYVIRK